MKTHVKNKEEEMPSIDSPPTTAIAHKAFLFEQKKRTKKKEAAEKKRIDKDTFLCNVASTAGDLQKKPIIRTAANSKKLENNSHANTRFPSSLSPRILR